MKPLPVIQTLIYQGVEDESDGVFTDFKCQLIGMIEQISPRGLWMIDSYAGGIHYHLHRRNWQFGGTEDGMIEQFLARTLDIDTNEIKVEWTGYYLLVTFSEYHTAEIRFAYCYPMRFSMEELKYAVDQLESACGHYNELIHHAADDPEYVTAMVQDELMDCLRTFDFNPQPEYYKLSLPGRIKLALNQLFRLYDNLEWAQTWCGTVWDQLDGLVRQYQYLFSPTPVKDPWPRNFQPGYEMLLKAFAIRQPLMDYYDLNIGFDLPRLIRDMDLSSNEMFGRKIREMYFTVPYHAEPTAKTIVYPLVDAIQYCLER